MFDAIHYCAFLTFSCASLFISQLRDVKCIYFPSHTDFSWSAMIRVLLGASLWLAADFGTSRWLAETVIVTREITRVTPPWAGCSTINDARDKHIVFMLKHDNKLNTSVFVQRVYCYRCSSFKNCIHNSCCVGTFCVRNVSSSREYWGFCSSRCCETDKTNKSHLMELHFSSCVHFVPAISRIIIYNANIDINFVFYEI